ncbi:hypothetical protein [Limnohabitans sp.]|uniref:hypothetical protein n=1 Tax=Limnohabitans sp. TaxID=1907725 RepID=UPI00286EEE25|nr:hypothetical protein [Limnohabitans sp.]
MAAQTLTLPSRPLRSLLLLLPLLSAQPGSKVAYGEVDPDLLVQLAEDAEAVIGTVQLGSSAIGQLMAHAAPEIEDRTVCSDTVEALGWLLSELNDAAATLMVLLAETRQSTVDYAPPKRVAVVPPKF